MALKSFTKTQVSTFYTCLRAALPNPGYDHPPVNDYQALVAILLSAQSTALGVERATTPLFEVISNPREMLALGEEALRDKIKTLGLFRTKARHVIALSQMLVADHGGQVPQDRSALLRLPGVGPKTADVVLNALFGHSTIGVDTHIFRVCNRTGLARGKTANEVAKVLKEMTPAPDAAKAHDLLFTIGREICKAGHPECWQCPVVMLCLYELKNLTQRKGLQPIARA